MFLCEEDRGEITQTVGVIFFKFLPPIFFFQVGGAVLSYKMDELVDGLKFLQHVGLKPIIVHGGGPQVYFLS